MVGFRIWHAEPRALDLLRMGSTALAVAGCILWGSWAYVDQKKLAVDKANENVTLVQQYTHRLIQTQTTVQRAVKVRAAAETDPAFLASRTFHDFLAGVEQGQGFTNGIAVVSLDGSVIASSRSFPVRARFGKRDYLAAIAGGATFYLDRIRLEPGGQDSMIIVTPFNHRDFKGAIASAIAVESIRSFLKTVAAGEGEAASLLREDGKLMVRQIPSDPIMLDPSTPARVAVRNGTSGVYEAKAVSDGTPRIYAFARVSDDIPVYANVGIPKSAVTRAWLRRSVPVWLLLISGGLFSSFLAGVIRRSQKESALREEQVRLREEAERRAEAQAQFMRELNHRVKNNLALVDSLISMQMRKKGHVDAEELRSRLRAITDVHDLLYKAANGYRIDLGELVEQLCESPAIVPRERDIRVECAVTPGLPIDATKATPLAMILVELLTNAVKHAFTGRSSGRIRVELGLEDGKARLLIADDGVGLSEKRERNSGLRIVAGLAQQLDGTITSETGSGTTHILIFPVS